ncbi:MAG: ankyrin repeat domain-containing protein [Gammaproteobacteria bacterium]
MFVIFFMGLAQAAPIFRKSLLDSEFDFFDSIKNNDFEKTTKMIENGHPIDRVLLKDNLQTSPLYLAAYYGDSELVKFLLKHGADPNKIDEYFKETPLITAVKKRKKDIIKILIENKANIHLNMDKNKNNNALYIATSMNDLDMVKYLVDLGYDLNTTLNQKDWSPLDIAIMGDYKDIFEFFLSKKAFFNHQLEGEGNSLNVALTMYAKDMALALIEKGINLNIKAKEKDDHPPIYMALLLQDFDIVKKLVAHGADFKNFRKRITRTDGGFHEEKCISVLNYSIGLRKNKEDSEILKFLLESGANPNPPSDIKCASPLSYIVFKKRPDMVDILLKHGANPYHEDEGGKNSFEYARLQRNTEIIKLLEDWKRK